MRKILALGLLVISLTGCASMKYSFNQVFGDQREFGKFQTSDYRDHSNDSLVAQGDRWVRNHLW